jgi:hypothetical protein
MRTLALIRWELVQMARGGAPHAALTAVALLSAALVGGGIVVMSLWSPFSASTPSFPGRIDPNSSSSVLPILGEYRGGATLLVLMYFLIFLGCALAPALSAGPVVRDRRSGRLDRVLTDASRADVVVLAKLLAALVPLVLIVLAAAPSLSFAWLVGGLARSDAVSCVAVVLGALVLATAIGLLCATLATTEVTALLTSYALVTFFLIGPLLASVGLALAGLHVAANVVASLDPLVGLTIAQPDLASKLFHLLPADWPAPPTIWTVGTVWAPAWIGDVVAYLALSAGLVWLAGVALEPFHPLKTWRLRRATRPASAGA